MNNNNLRTNTGEWISQNPYPSSGRRPQGTQPPEYNIQVNQANSANNKLQATQHRYVNQPRNFDPQFKQKNKAMYNSSMPFSTHNQSTPSLLSFARQVNQTSLSKDTNQSDKYLGVNNIDKYNNFSNKNSFQSIRNNKMASSAIFPDNSINNPLEFNRFPAFNIGVGQNSQQSAMQNPNYNQVTKQNPNQTPQQKKQRELMQIKRQLDQINKKMMLNAQKNKNTHQNTETGSLRPPKPAGISHSMIIDSDSGVGYSQSGYGGYGPIQHNNTRPLGGMQNLSIDALYNQSKKINQAPKLVQQPYKSYSNTGVDELYVGQQNAGEKFQNYNNNSNKKEYQYSKSIQQSKSPIQPTYDTNANKTQNNYKIQNKYQFQTPPKTESSYKYEKYGIDNSQKPQIQLSSNNYGGYSSSSFNNNSAEKVNSFSKSNNTPHLQTTPSYNPSSQHQPSYGFKKKKEAIICEPGQIKKTQLIKKNNPNGPQITTDIKKTVVYPQTSQQSQHRNFNLKKTDSISYTDPTITPLPQLKKFKISDFAIGKKMGKGQFGQVMLVRHKATGFLCGLKVMQKKQIRSQDYVGQIARQLSIQFYLSHRNIAPLYGFFDDEKNVYLLVQFCTGGQLLQKLRGERRMNQKDVAVIMKQVCEGIDYIHKQLIIHRDIKPENILFNFGIVKISDFGWAVYRGFGMRKTASGSPLYYPPQIVKGEQYDDKIDVWNIGMMTYECILGKIPFRVYTQLDLNRIVQDQITFPSWVDVTDQAKDFILKTMKKKGEERMQIRQMLRHPFITKNQSNQVSQSMLEQFRRILE